MQFETLKRSHLKRNIIIAVVVIAIISAIVLTFTRAKYRVTQSIPLVNGTINYSPFDIRVSTKLLIGEDEYLELDTIPTSNSVSLISSTCTNDAILTWNSEQSRYEIANLTKKGTKCEAIYAISNSIDFDYTGNIQEFIAPEEGEYLLEVWGAEGGSATNGESRAGGYGGYSKGIVTLNQNDKLYVVVGGKGIDGTSTTTQTGGYNGGGNGLYHGGSGGGATHIATQTGLLSSLSNNIDSILIVAGGGGGGAVTNNMNCSDGGHGGGISGNNSITNACSDTIDYGRYATGATQSSTGTPNTGASFGLGASSPTESSDYGTGGGGGGLYGGGSGIFAGGAGGSGYIGNASLNDKAMYCYECEISDDENTKTVSISSSSEMPISNTAKENNGHAKITLLGEQNYQAYQPQFDISVATNGRSINITVTPNSNNLFDISKYYYSINDEYIESDNNTYTFENLEEGKYEVKVYIVDNMNLTSEVQSNQITVADGLLIADILEANYKTIKTRSSFDTIVSDTTTGTIYKSLDENQYDNDGEVYYFAGNPTDNWVKFAGFYWRIIRINGDGTIRMIYQGTTANTTGTGTQIGTSAFNSLYDYNTSKDDAYLGYMYTIGLQHGLSNSSTIKDYLDNWFIDNLNKYISYIDSESNFCNDRNIFGVDDQNITLYAAYNRMITNLSPSFKCSNNEDLFTINSSSTGNKALTYPIGLITADEVTYAGGIPERSTANKNYYLYTNMNYWTMTPTHSGAISQLTSGGTFWFSTSSPNGEIGVRPVINLKSDTLFEVGGTGTSTNPYVVIGAE